MTSRRAEAAETGAAGAVSPAAAAMWGHQGRLSRLSPGARRGPHRLPFRELYACRGLAYGSTPPPENLEFYPRDPGLCSWKIAVGTMWPAQSVATGTCPAVHPLSLPT